MDFTFYHIKEHERKKTYAQNALQHTCCRNTYLNVLCFTTDDSGVARQQIVGGDTLFFQKRENQITKGHSSVYADNKVLWTRGC